MTVAFKTFGCRLNHAESLDLEAALGEAGHAIVALEGDIAPDCIILRGCSVTAKAQRECERTLAQLRSRYPNARIHVTGCLPGSQPVPVEITSAIPRSTSRAYLKIQDGCSGRCSFCIVPHFRGPPVSIPFTDVLARAQAFLDAGFRELVVTGCNLALYRDAASRLSDVLSALASLESSDGLSPRIRLGSLEPGLCGLPLLDVLERHSNICAFLHLSLQSASDSVLKRMNRPYTRTQVDSFCAEARRRFGRRLALGADVITGFPGETEGDFKDTREFLVRHAFTNLHVFPYSERPGTPAASFSEAVPHAVRQDRAHILGELGKSQRHAFAQSLVGQEVEVCVERGGDHGWTAEYLPCRLDQTFPRRSLVTRQVRAVTGDTLLA